MLIHSGSMSGGRSPRARQLSSRDRGVAAPRPPAESHRQHSAHAMARSVSCASGLGVVLAQDAARCQMWQDSSMAAGGSCGSAGSGSPSMPPRLNSADSRSAPSSVHAGSCCGPFGDAHSGASPHPGPGMMDPSRWSSRSSSVVSSVSMNELQMTRALRTDDATQQLSQPSQPLPSPPLQQLERRASGMSVSPSKPEKLRPRMPRDSSGSLSSRVVAHAQTSPTSSVSSSHPSPQISRSNPRASAQLPRDAEPVGEPAGENGWRAVATSPPTAASGAHSAARSTDPTVRAAPLPPPRAGRPSEAALVGSDEVDAQGDDATRGAGDVLMV